MGIMTKMRVLVFSDPDVSSIVEALSPFANVKKVNWHYRHISDRARYTCLKIPYRAIEGLYWVIRLIREIYLFRADVVLAQYAYFSGLIGAVAAELSGKVFVIRAVGSDLRVHSQSFMGRIMVLLTLKISSGVICVSKDLEKRAQRLGAKSTVVIPSPLMLPRFDETSVQKKRRKIISVARLVPIKGMSYLLRAMTYVKDGSLVIIGDGPERRKLELLSRRMELSDRVFFAGWISDRSRILDHLRQAAVFVLPSLSEGLPRVLIEAMACGLPVVATNVGGVPEVVVDGVNGLLVPPRDEKALAEAIEHVFNDNDFQRRASEENMNATTEYLPSIIGQRIFNYLEKVLHNTN
jgi:glycosyltransferase involved in cell wall biosynthesis